MLGPRRHRDQGAAACTLRKGGMTRLETLIELKFLHSSFSSSNLSIRAFRAYPLAESRQTVPCSAIRGKSSDSRQPYLSQEYHPTLLILGWLIQVCVFLKPSLRTGAVISARVPRQAGPKIAHCSILEPCKTLHLARFTSGLLFAPKVFRARGCLGKLRYESPKCENGRMLFRVEPLI